MKKMNQIKDDINNLLRIKNMNISIHAVSMTFNWGICCWRQHFESFLLSTFDSNVKKLMAILSNNFTAPERSCKTKRL